MMVDDVGSLTDPYLIVKIWNNGTMKGKTLSVERFQCAVNAR